jgi:16S rRNA (cytosine1402-N4)-methyltransferase
MLEIVHTPVLLEETIQPPAPRGRHEMMIDATIGEGGHTYAFLSRFPDRSVIGIDADSSVQAVAKERLAEFGSRVQFYQGWSHDFFIDYPVGLQRPNTILADLGISHFQYVKSGRGFSFSGDEKLDMRLDPSGGVSAAEILARMPEKEIADILYRNAEERYSRRIARAIVQERQRGAITSNAALSELVKRTVPASYRHGSVHPATKTFMALRIEVNQELFKLPGLLESALAVLQPGGRFGVISFHSLEDRIVKNFFKMKNKDCTCPPQAPSCTCAGRRAVKKKKKKGITPGDAEIKQNPPSRSARLRVAEKVMEAQV